MTERHVPPGDDGERWCFPHPEDGHNCALRADHDGPHLCCDGHEWWSTMGRDEPVPASPVRDEEA
jgi:hypothetical protein